MLIILAEFLSFNAGIQANPGIHKKKLQDQFFMYLDTLKFSKISANYRVSLLTYWSGQFPKFFMLKNIPNVLSVFHIRVHSTPNGAKFWRLEHDPSQNLIKVCKVVTVYKI